MPRSRDHAPSASDAPVAEEPLLDAAVLGFVLAEHPAPLTRAEVVRELVAPGYPVVAIEDAITRLVAAGLLHRSDEFAQATRAAAYMNALPLP